jgi:arylsulfatase A-like enzyme
MLAPAISMGLLLLSCGREPSSRTAPGPGPGIESLLDQVPDDMPAGPWSALTLEGGTSADGDNRVRLDGGGQRRPLSGRREFNSGGTVVVRLAYGGPWRTSATVEARLLKDDAIVAVDTSALGRSWAELRVATPAAGADELQIVHRTGHQEEMPSASAMALEVHSSDSRVLRRASAMLAWAVRAPATDAQMVLGVRKFGLTREGTRRNAVALSSGDTLTFEVPPGLGIVQLRFWSAALRVIPSEPGRLVVEWEDESGWREIGSWDARDLSGAGWRPWDSLPFSRARRIRFMMRGVEHLVAVGSPLLTADPELGPTRKNVILIDLDTMRADRLGCYGYRERPTSARLDSVLSAKGFFLFTHAYSAGPWTLPATAKFMTSRYRNIDRDATLPGEHTTLAETLRGQGYYCAAFTGGGILRLPGFEQGFHRYHWSEELGDDYGKVESTFPMAAAWLRKTDLRPFFLFVHTYEPHRPYTRDVFCKGLPHGRLGDLSRGEHLKLRTVLGHEWNGALSRDESLYVQAAYDGGVRVACDATADLLTLVDDLDLWGNTVVVILSDHGEEFREHSNVFADHCDESVYGETIDVPFLFYDPAHARAGIQRIENAVSTVDLVPTIAGALGLAPADHCDGVNLGPLLAGGTIARPVPIIAMSHPGFTPGSVRSAVIVDGLKYIAADTAIASPALMYPRHEQLYDLRRDPREASDLAALSPKDVDRLARLLRDGLSAAAPLVEAAADTHPAISPKLLEQLRALGYAVSDSAR